MGVWAKLRGRKRPGALRRSGADDEAHLRAWAAAHEGVEAFVEPQTTVTDTTVVLVAKDGEWTRRRTATAATATHFTWSRCATGG